MREKTSRLDLDKLCEFGMLLNRLEKNDDALALILSYVSTITGVKKVALTLFDADTDNLEMKASLGYLKEEINLFPTEKEIIRKIARNGNFIVDEKNRGVISLPLFVANEVIGFLHVTADNGKNEFTKEELKLLALLGSHIAPSLGMLQIKERSQNAYIEMIETLARAIDAKDPYTKGHSDRVSRYASDISRQMGLCKNEISEIRHMALLHDIGKIGVKEGILTKQGRLSFAEFDAVKMHPLIGERIISPVKLFKNSVHILLYHHEHFDGTGYLEGLKGSDIPLGARILAVADSYDAMVSERPYRSAIDKDIALGELEKESGQQFDPDVVKAFLKNSSSA
ncbi:MAG: HD-GYP domain-containing protein [bacterium]